jgi:hypothetical protein
MDSVQAQLALTILIFPSTININNLNVILISI